MHHGKSLFGSPGAVAPLALSMLLVACAVAKDDAARDSSLASTLSTTAAAPAPTNKHTGWKADGAGGWERCREADTAPAYVALNFTGSTLNTTDAEAVALYDAAYGECFLQDHGRDASPVGMSTLTYDEADFQTVLGTVTLRFRPSSYTHAMNPDSASAGHGFIAGAYKHTAGPAFKTAGGKLIVAINRSVLLWMGMDTGGQRRYALLDLPRYPAKGQGPITAADVKLIGSGAIVTKPASVKMPTSYARFADPNPHPRSPGVAVPPDGSWVECDAGCCVAGMLENLFFVNPKRTHAVLTDSLNTDP